MPLTKRGVPSLWGRGSFPDISLEQAILFFPDLEALDEQQVSSLCVSCTVGQQLGRVQIPFPGAGHHCTASGSWPASVTRSTSLNDVTALPALLWSSACTREPYFPSGDVAPAPTSI